MNKRCNHHVSQALFQNIPLNRRRMRIVGHIFNNQELALFVDKVGLTPLQALQAATINAADYLQLTDLGRLEEGARADIVLLEKNPLEPSPESLQYQYQQASLQPVG